LDSLGNKGLAAYLIAADFGLRASVERTGAGKAGFSTRSVLNRGAARPAKALPSLFA
jgi:hypothetical protein